MFASQENRQHVLGHLSLLGLKRPVYPWSTDGPDEAGIGEALETTLSHWADACHAQGGTVVVPHFPAPNGEPAALIATGRADAVEMVVDSAYGLEEYYRYLNAGYRMPLAGGTDKMSSDVPVGLFRTYVHLPEADLEYDAWCRGLRRGATFISSGPLLRFVSTGAWRATNCGYRPRAAACRSRPRSAPSSRSARSRSCRAGASCCPRTARAARASFT